MGIIILKYISVVMLSSIAVTQHLNRKPWPTYSLHNMPRTGFTCRDKILGGYYADSETQCQMFHVCVKVAGVGVQDFRFLCPNGTAFDQEAQICADWGDVDCEQATLYYSSDNFDLYRLGSNFENKRAPLAEEEESTFHLQRAESNDIRRSKQSVVDQRSRSGLHGEYKEVNRLSSGRPQIDTTHTTPQGRKNNGYFGATNENNGHRPHTSPPTKSSQYSKPAFNSQNTAKSNNNQQEDELLRGAHSSSFFSKNNDKDEDTADFNHNFAAPRTQPNRGTGKNQNRGQQRSNYNNDNKIVSVSTKIPQISAIKNTQTPFEPKLGISDGKSQTLTLQSSFRATSAEPKQQKSPNEYLPRTQTNLPFTPTPTTPPQNEYKIQPTTYNPSNNGYRIKTTTNRYDVLDEFEKQPNPDSSQPQTPFYNTREKQNSRVNTQPQTSFYNAREKQPSPVNNQPQTPLYNTRFESRAKDYNTGNTEQSVGKKIGVTKFLNSTELNNNNNNDGPSVGFFNNDTPTKSETSKVNLKNNERRRYDEFLASDTEIGRNHQEIRLRGEIKRPNGNRYNARLSQEDDQLTVRPLDPQKFNAAFNNETSISRSKEPFSNDPAKSSSRGVQLPQYNDFTRLPSTSPPIQSSQGNFISQEQTPRGFSRTTPAINRISSNSNINSRKSQSNNFDKIQSSTRTNENFTPASPTKKFSTLVPKDQFYPTTFKPTTYKKQIEDLHSKVESFHTQAVTPRPSLPPNVVPKKVVNNNEPDEDDGQYHPELYEKDLPRNHLLKSQKAEHVDTFSDEDEFLKTAHSLNIGAAGVNHLRSEKAKQSSPNNLFKSTSATSKKPPPSPLPATSTSKHSKNIKKSKPDEDTSYDYAYYDTNSGNVHDYAEYDIISEFGKTKKH